MNKLSNVLDVLEINVTEMLGEEYVPMIEDIMKMFTLQVFVQLMMVLRNPYEFSLFDVDFIELLLYVILGVCVYWLVFKKLVVFK